MTRAIIGIGVGLGALALGGICYKAIDRQRRRRGQKELDQRLDTWEAEGGAPVPARMQHATRAPSSSY
jgi:hypothetical protein